MPIVANPEPGVVLAGEFDRRHPAVQEELKQFTDRLAALQRQQGFAAFLPVASEQNGVVRISIIPIALGAPGSLTAADVPALGKSLTDKFTGSGRLTPSEPAAPDPYQEAPGVDASDMLANWFPQEGA